MFSILTGLIGEVLRGLVTNFHIGKWRRPTEVGVVAAASSGVPSLADMFVDCDQFVAEFRALRAHLADVDGADAFPAAALIDIFLMLAASDTTPPKFKFDCMLSGSGEHKVKLAALTTVLKMYNNIYQLVMVIGYFKWVSFSMTSTIYDHKLKPDILVGVAKLGHLLKALDGFLGTVEVQDEDVVGVPWAVVVDTAKSIARAAAAFDKILKKALAGFILEEAYQVAQSVNNYTSQHAHVLNGSVYHHRTKLSSETIALFTTMKYCGQMHAQWQVSPPLAEDEDLGEKISFCQSGYTAAKQALPILAAVVIIETKKGDVAKSEAMAMLKARRASLPPALCDLLEAIASGTKTGTSKAKALSAQTSAT